MNRRKRNLTLLFTSLLMISSVPSHAWEFERQLNTDLINDVYKPSPAVCWSYAERVKEDCFDRKEAGGLTVDEYAGCIQLGENAFEQCMDN